MSVFKNVYFVIFLFAASSGYAQKSGNPIFPGWYADPDAATFKGLYWVYPTYSAKYKDQIFMDAYSSKDLITWVKHDRIIDTAAVKWAKKAMWAPAIIQKKKKFYLFFGANDIQSDAEAGGIGVAVSNKPNGPFKDLLGKPLVDKFYNGAQPIDQTVFKDTDGSYYLIYGGWSHCNIAKLNNNFDGFIPNSDGSIFKEITPENYVEGPYMFKKDDKYYFMWSEGGWTGPDYSVAYAIGETPTGPFKRIGKILKQDPEVATGAGHHSIIHNEKTNDWYIVYHRRPLGETNGNHRVVCIDKMEFDANGLILPVKTTFSGMESNPLQ